MTRIVPLDSDHADYSRINNLAKHASNTEVLLKYLASDLNYVYTAETKEKFRQALEEPEQKFIELSDGEVWPLDPVTQRLIIPVNSHTDICPLLKENFLDYETEQSKTHPSYTGRQLLANIKYIVISKNPTDLMMCSTNQMFSSCSCLDSHYSYSTSIPALILQPNMYIIYGVSNLKYKKWELPNSKLKLHNLKYTFRAYMFEVEEREEDIQLPTGIEFLRKTLSRLGGSSKVGALSLADSSLMTKIKELPTSTLAQDNKEELKELCNKYRRRIRANLNTDGVPPLATKILSNLFGLIIEQYNNYVQRIIKPKYLITRLYSPSFSLEPMNYSRNYTTNVVEINEKYKPILDRLLDGMAMSMFRHGELEILDLTNFFTKRNSRIIMAQDISYLDSEGGHTSQNPSNTCVIKGDLEMIRTNSGENCLSYIDHTFWNQQNSSDRKWSVKCGYKTTALMSSRSTNEVSQAVSSFAHFVWHLEAEQERPSVAQRQELSQPKLSRGVPGPMPEITNVVRRTAAAAMVGAQPVWGATPSPIEPPIEPPQEVE